MSLKEYNDKLPLLFTGRLPCCHMNTNGDRCENRAKYEYHVFEDPELGGDWFVVYVCKEHLAGQMQVDAVIDDIEDEPYFTVTEQEAREMLRGMASMETPRTFA